MLYNKGSRSPAIQHCTHNFVAHSLRCLHYFVAHSLRCLHYSQACIPLSYAAQIPTTSDPDLANVRVSLLYLDQKVWKCRARVCVRVRVYVYVYVCVLVSKCVFERKKHV